MVDGASGKGGVKVRIGRPPAAFLGLVRVVDILDAEVSVASQWLEQLRRGKQRKLNAGPFRAGGVEREQDLDHALVRTRLWHQLDHEPKRVAIDKDLVLRRIRNVGQPRGELIL